MSQVSENLERAKELYRIMQEQAALAEVIRAAQERQSSFGEREAYIKMRLADDQGRGRYAYRVSADEILHVSVSPSSFVVAEIVRMYPPVTEQAEVK